MTEESKKDFREKIEQYVKDNDKVVNLCDIREYLGDRQNDVHFSWEDISEIASIISDVTKKYNKIFTISNGKSITYLGEEHNVNNPFEVEKVMETENFNLFGFSGVNSKDIVDACSIKHKQVHERQAIATGVVLDIFNIMLHSGKYNYQLCYGWMNDTRIGIENIFGQETGFHFDTSFAYLYPERLDIGKILNEAKL